MKNRFLILLAAVMLFDFGLTIAGQPPLYWHDPLAADEGNPLFRWAMIQGWPIYFAVILTYIAGVLLLVSRLPRQAAFVTGFAFLLTHYCAGSTWLLFHFHTGMTGPILSAVALSVALAALCGGEKFCFSEAK